MLNNDEGENKRILAKYGDLMAEEEKEKFLSSRKDVLQKAMKGMHEDQGPTMQDVICGFAVIALTVLMRKASLLSVTRLDLSLAVLTLLMVLSPWGCLALSWNKKEEWIFYVIGRSSLGNETQKRRGTGTVWFVLVMTTVMLMERFFRFFALFWFFRVNGWCMLHRPNLSDIDSRGSFKKIYSTFVCVAPFIFSSWFFMSFPGSSFANLTSIDFLVLLALTQGAWFLNWFLVAFLSVYSFLCELPSRNSERGNIVRNEIKERYRASFKDGKDRKIFRVGLFVGAVVICLFISMPIMYLQDKNPPQLFLSAGLILVWLIFLFLIVMLVRSHITNKLRCYVFHKESESAALVLDEKLLVRQYKSLKIAAWFLFFFYLIGVSVFYYG